MATARKVTSFPYCVPLDPSREHIQGTSPSRVWERTDSGWASREWAPGERQQYIREILNRQPHSGEI